MIKLTIMYPNGEDTTFNKNYYANEHSQMLKELLGNDLISSDINLGIAGGNQDQPAPYVVISNLTFESMETFQRSFGANTGKILEDLLNFTNVTPIVQISEIALD